MSKAFTSGGGQKSWNGLGLKGPQRTPSSNPRHREGHLSLEQDAQIKTSQTQINCSSEGFLRFLSLLKNTTKSEANFSLIC